MSEQKEQSWCHCSLSGVEPTCGKPMVDDGTDFCENRLPDGTYCAHGPACHSLPDQAEPEPTNWQAHAEALAEALELARRTLAMAALEGEVTRRIDAALAAFDRDKGVNHE